MAIVIYGHTAAAKDVTLVILQQYANTGDYYKVAAMTELSVGTVKMYISSTVALNKGTAIVDRVTLFVELLRQGYIK